MRLLLGGSLRSRSVSSVRRCVCTLLALQAVTSACGAGRHASAERTTPAADAQAAGPRRTTALLADSLFWRTLHAGAYDSIPRAMIALKAAYLENPQDAITAARIGFLHTWRTAERHRLVRLLPTITDDVVLARYFFDQANAKGRTYDARTHGFAAVMGMVEGSIHGQPHVSAAALRHGRETITRWPEFNLFTIGYALSTRPDTSPAFREGLEMQWRALELCRRAAVNRDDPAFQPGLGQGQNETDAQKRRACYNSWIAPHNIEGFFLNMGDMVLKSGDWRRAQKVYALARQAEAYPEWPYRTLLEERMQTAEARADAAKRDPREMMYESRFACTACHQAR